LLITRLLADDGLTDLAVDMAYGLEHALAQIALGISVAQFDRLAGAGGGTRGYCRAAACARIQHHGRLYGGVTSGIEDLQALNM
jgi:tryptophan synthase beta subunit